MQQDQFEKPDRTILIAGAPGVGKSSMIIQQLTEMGMPYEEAFIKAPSGMNSNGVTEDFTPISAPNKLQTQTGECSMRIVDTPGLGGKKGKIPKMAKKYGELAEMQNLDVDTFLFCMEANNIRIDATVEQYLNQLFKIGKKPEQLFDKLFFCITKCNTFQGDIEEINRELRNGLENADFQNDPESKMQKVVNGRLRSQKPLSCFVDDKNAGKAILTLFAADPDVNPPQLRKVPDEELFEAVGDAMGMDIEDPAECEKFKGIARSLEGELASERKKFQEALNKPRGFWSSLGRGILCAGAFVGKTIADTVTVGQLKTPTYSDQSNAIFR